MLFHARSRRSWGALLGYLSLFVSVHAGAKDSLHDSAAFFSPALVKGQEVSQIFSRTISTRVEGFDWIARRISGTGSYRLSSVSNGEFVFDTTFLYDGRPLGSGISKIRRDGAESCWQDKCSAATDASGLLFNTLIWGTPPKRIGVGTSWHTKIAMPWELGPPGEEDVTVVALDASNGAITLLRKGSGAGSFDSDPAQIKLTKDGKEFVMDAKAGNASWSGYTTVARGIIVSDELLVERTLSLSSKELGEMTGMQRQYILLNKTPQSAAWEG